MKKIIPAHVNDKPGSIIQDNPTHSVNKLHARINPFVRFCGCMWFSIQKPFLSRRISKPSIEFIDDVPLLSLPGVLSAVVFRGGEFLAQTVANHECAAPPQTTSCPLALDMGTGSGAGAIFAARRGYQVIGVDINPQAVRCARVNVLLNNLEDKIEIREGDLFSPVTDQRFHLVLFNPPFYEGEPRSLSDLAWRSTDVIERFAAGLSNVLAADGLAMILLSTDGSADGMLKALTVHGFFVEPIISRHFGNEIMAIYSARLINTEGKTSSSP